MSIVASAFWEDHLLRRVRLVEESRSDGAAAPTDEVVVFCLWIQDRATFGNRDVDSVVIIDL